MSRGKLGFLFLVCILIFATSLAGCSSTDTVSNNTEKDTYPDKPITLIIPFDPGGASDIALRAIQPFLSKELGVPVLIENRPGAKTQVGANEFMRKPDDGYTFFQFNQPQLSWTILAQKATYKIEDFCAINAFHKNPSAICVLDDSPYNSFKDFINDVKARPGQVKVGVTASSPHHVLALWLNEKLGVDFVIVPYDGGAEARAALFGKHVDVTVADIPTIINEGFKPLALDDEEESSLLPEAPLLLSVLKEEYGVTVDDKPFTESFRALAAHASFKEKYPDRWNTFLEAYERAFNNPEHLAKLKELNMEDISNFESPEATQEQMLKIHNDFSQYIDLLMQ
jgi:putative tricarboxylic transport membrane protein